MEKHAVFSPSKLSRIIACPGSVNLIANLLLEKKIGQSISSVYAQKGTDLHAIFVDYYSNARHKSYIEGLDVVDRVMIMDCADYLDMIIKGFGHNNFDLTLEVKVNLSEWGLAEVYGTVDVKLLELMTRHLHIIDWKFGSGIIVYAKDNPQLLAYTAGGVGWPTYIKECTMHIFQPAIDHISVAKTTSEDLFKWTHWDLSKAIIEATCMKEQRFNPGIEQCRWCEAKNHCRTRMDFVQEHAAKLFAAKEILATCPEPKELVELLKMAPLVEKTIKDIKAFITQELQLGKEYSGMKLVRGRANRKWKSEKDATQWLAKNTKIEELFTSKLRSPSQLETEFKLLKKNDIFKTLYESPLGKPTLVPESDKRPAIQAISKAIDVFKNY